jgi:hypothetical protein
MPLTPENRELVGRQEKMYPIPPYRKSCTVRRLCAIARRLDAESRRQKRIILRLTNQLKIFLR